MVSQIRSEPWGWCGEAFAGVNARLTSALLQAVDKSSHVGSMCAAAGDDVTGSQRPRQHHVRRLCNRSTMRRVSRWQHSMIEAGLLLVALASVAWPTWSFRWNKRLPSHSSFPHGSLPSTRPSSRWLRCFGRSRPSRWHSPPPPEVLLLPPSGPRHTDHGVPGVAKRHATPSCCCTPHIPRIYYRTVATTRHRLNAPTCPALQSSS